MILWYEYINDSTRGDITQPLSMLGIKGLDLQITYLFALSILIIHYNISNTYAVSIEQPWLQCVL